jgi:hypothetical protein
VVGIAAMFAELSGDEPDWFQLAFCFERANDERKERQRYRDWLRAPNQTRRAKCREYQRKYATKPNAIELRRARQRAYWHRKQAERRAA